MNSLIKVTNYYLNGICICVIGWLIYSTLSICQYTLPFVIVAVFLGIYITSCFLIKTVYMYEEEIIVVYNTRVCFRKKKFNYNDVVDVVYEHYSIKAFDVLMINRKTQKAIIIIEPDKKTTVKKAILLFEEKGIYVIDKGLK